MNDNRPIGVFDSGIGGLTVVKQVRKILPKEDIIYLGDTARVPYGNKSHKIIEHYAIQDAAFLLEQNVKAIIVACNTASAHGVTAIKERYPAIPVFEMIESGSLYAVSETRTKRIGVIGTQATIASNHYEEKILDLEPAAFVCSGACPLFVPLVEEGLIKHQITESAIKLYLTEIKKMNIDTLILGCTHYPMLKEQITNFLGEGVYLIDSGKAAAHFVYERLKQTGLLSAGNSPGYLNINLSCYTPSFESTATLILEEKIKEINFIDLESVVV